MEAKAVTFPDDIVLEILVRLSDEASLFRCAATCKLWMCLVADRSFLHRRWPDKSRHPSGLIGFFVNKWHIPGEILGLPVQSAAAQTFVPGPRSVLGLRHGRRSLGSLVPIADSLFDRVTPLASDGGLLLVRFVPRCACVPLNSYPTFIHLAVCNLFAGTCEVLPPLLYKTRIHNVYLDGFAILTGEDNFCSNAAGQQRLPLPGFSVLFKVLIIGTSQDEAVHYDLYMFSSDEPSWTAPHSCLDHLKHKLIQNNAVVRRGTAHWLCWDFSNVYSFDVNADTGHVSLAKLPVSVTQRFIFFPYSSPRLTIGADGTLMLVRLHIIDLWLEIWTLQENEESADRSANYWLLTRVVEIQQPKHESLVEAECVCFMEKNGTLLLADKKCNAYLVDLQTGAVEEMTDRFTGRECKTAVPVDIDWPAFFLSRLKGH